MKKATADMPVTHRHGALLITTRIYPTHIAFDVNTGAGQIRELCKTFDNRDQAATYYRHVARAAEQGIPTWQIIAEVQVLQDAQLAAAINDTMDEATAAYLAPRQQARRIAAEVVQKPRNLGAFAQPGRVNTRPAPRNTLSPRLLAQAFDAATPAGDIYIGPGVSERFLRAMANHNLGRLVTGGVGRRTHEVVKLHLNPAGQALRNLHRKETAR